MNYQMVDILHKNIRINRFHQHYMSSKNIKVSVANLAAQLILEEGIKDYLFAKKKAAKSLGIN